MSSLLAARAGFVTALQTIAGANVYTHGGTFDRKQLEAYARKAPALVLTLLRFDAGREGGYPVARAHWGLVAFAKNTPGVLRDAGAIALIESAMGPLLHVFAGTSATQTVSTPVKEITCRNLFGTELDAEGVAMWGAEFEQQLDLVQLDESVALQTLQMSWDLAPDPDGTYEAQDLLENLDV